MCGAKICGIIKRLLIVIGEILFFMLHMFFPITGMFLDPLLIFLTGLFGGFISGFLGIGCGIVITPMLMEFGIPPLIAVSTQLCHAVGTNFTNFLTYKRKMDVDYHLALYIFLGGLFGAATEWIIIRASNDSQSVFNKFLYVYIFILVIFGFVMLYQSYRTLKHKGNKKHIKIVSMRKWMIYLPFHKIFVRSRTEMSIIIPIFVGFLAGILVSSLGGGNNLFMTPILTYLIGRISPVVNGTTSLVGCIITAIIALIYSLNDYCCDMFFVLFLFVGAAFGSWIGVKLTYRFPRHHIYTISAIVIFILASRQIFKLFNNSFSSMVNVKANLSQSVFTKLFDIGPFGYTLICIITIIIIALIYERSLQKWADKHHLKTAKKRKKQ